MRTRTLTTVSDPVDLEHLEPVKVDTAKVILAGIACWVVALVVLLIIPALHTEGRSWWPWVPVVGILLGALGYAYVRRGRGNASAA